MKKAKRKDDHWLTRPQTIRKLWIGFILVLALTVLPDLIWPPHGHFGVDSYIGFAAAYGFVACVVLIAVAKLLGLFLKRKDTYYDE